MQKEPHRCNARTKRQLVWFGWLCLLFFCLLSIPISQAAKAVFKFDNIGGDKGLDNPYVIDVMQDRQGFIWVASQNGLYRYDGYDFKLYKHDPQDSSSLADNYIECLFEDSQGTFWVGTHGGVLHKFIWQSGTFKRLLFDQEHPKTTSSTSHIMSIDEDQEQHLWVGTLGAGFHLLDLKTDLFVESYRHNPSDNNSLSDDKIYQVLQDRQGILWIGTRNGGLNRFDKKTGQVTRYQHDPADPTSLSHNKVFSLFEDSHETLWVGTRGGGLNRFDHKTGVFKHYRHALNNPNSLGSDHIYSIFEDDGGRLWVGTDKGGLHRFDHKRENFVRYQNDPYDEFSLGDNDVYSIIQDQTGLIWMGTFGGGLSKFDPSSERFGLVQHDTTHPNRLSKGNVSTFYKNEAGILWIGTQGGLDRYNENTDTYQHYRHDPNNKQSLSENDVQTVFEDSKGTVWAGTRATGLNRLHQADNTFTRYRHQQNQANSLSDDNVLVIDEDNAGNIWIGTQNGLNRYDAQTNQFTRYLPVAGDATSISHNTIYTLVVTSNGTLWVGTGGGGLNQFDATNETFTHFQFNPENPNSLSHNVIFSMAEDRQKQLWIGTAGGLNKYNPDTGSFSHYRQKDGLPSDRIMAVMSDKNDKLWLSARGISLFDPVSGEIQSNIGSQADCGAGQGAYFQSSDGQMFFGNSGGYCGFYPEQVIVQSQPPTVVFTDFRLLNQSVPVSNEQVSTPLTKAINHAKSLTLGFEDNLMSFEFSALHYGYPEENQFAYQLEGWDKNWIETSFKNRRATYTNLPGGSYTLRVKASNAQGVWNEKGLSLALIISPPWWLTWWAKLLFFVVVSCGLFGLYRLRVSIFTRRTLFLEQQVTHHTDNISVLSDVGKEITSNLDMDTILDTVYRHVNTLMDATIFGVGFYREKKQVIEYRLAMESNCRYDQYKRDMNDKNQFAVWCIENKKPILINDVEKEYSQYIEDLDGLMLSSQLSDGAEPQRPNSMIYIPLLINQKVLGIITVQSLKIDAYGPHHMDMLQTLAAYTATAVENANAYREIELINRSLERMVAERTADLEQSNQSIRALSEIGTEISSTLDLTTLLNTVYSHIKSLMDVDVFWIGLYEPDNKRIVFKQASECELQLPEFHLSMDDKSRIAVWCIEHQEPVIFSDFTLDYPRYFGDLELPASKVSQQVESLMYWPLMVAGHIVGVLSVQSYRKNAYNENQQEMIHTLASTTAIALDNAHAYREAEVQKVEVEQKNREILATQQQLVQVEKMMSLGILTAGVAHEINNPSNFVRNSVKSLATELTDFRHFLFELAGKDAEEVILESFRERFKPMYEHLKTIEDGADRIQVIVRDLRTFTQLDSADHKIISITECLQSTINLVSTQNNSKIEFITAFVDDPDLLCYPAQLNQVFINLIVNACDAVREKAKYGGFDGQDTKGQVIVGCCMNNKSIEVTVKDDGQGMSEKTKTKLFEPFYTTKGVGEGTGLGLSISYGIVQKHDGELTVESEEGIGTIFTLTLPV
jgi:ligand-binding sensor domain-containing protein/signal transduction histidine kinase